MINALVNGNWKRKKEVSEGGRKKGRKARVCGL